MAIALRSQICDVTSPYECATFYEKRGGQVGSTGAYRALDTMSKFSLPISLYLSLCREIKLSVAVMYNGVCAARHHCT